MILSSKNMATKNKRNDFLKLFLSTKCLSYELSSFHSSSLMKRIFKKNKEIIFVWFFQLWNEYRSWQNVCRFIIQVYGGNLSYLPCDVAKAEYNFKRMWCFCYVCSKNLFLCYNVFLVFDGYSLNENSTKSIAFI